MITQVTNITSLLFFLHIPVNIVRIEKERILPLYRRVEKGWLCWLSWFKAIMRMEPKTKHYTAPTSATVVVEESKIAWQ